MPSQTRPSGRKPKPKQQVQETKQQKRKRGEDSLQALQAKVDALDLKADHKDFTDLPLSDPTSSGLRGAHFTTLTDVQARAIPLALQKRDILGAAKTGSGKTLAFLIPVLEILHRAQWTEFDGLGALILSPTRELAVQIFEVLRKIGRHHAFSAGLIIGGKNLKEEAERMSKMNILVCTPGRMLQHLDQTAGFEANNLQILVLDEADRIMDMGFQHAVDALVEHLPKDRQTLMFSATQSKKVSDLARLSLKDPEYVSVHEAASHATPTNLQQHYIVTPVEEKLDTVYGFIKANLKSKIIVFLSSGKQVRFVYESFRRLQPGIPLLHLHGRQKQTARLGITQSFTTSKNSCLFATDVVARGIDFPAVDWVIQADCPEDADTYIHRAGRTARYESNGRAVLFLEPSEEEGMIKKLEQKKIPIQKINVKDNKKRSIQNHLQNLCFQNPDLRYLGQKAFISYTRAIRLRMDKDVFKFNKLDLDAYATSLGLPGTPQTNFKDNGENRKKLKNAERQGMSSDSESEFDEDGNKKPRQKKKDQVRTKYDKMFERTNQDVLSSHYSNVVANDSDSDDDILTAKRTLKDDDLDEAAGSLSTLRTLDLGGKDPYVIDSKRREKALKSKKKMAKFKGSSSKIVFDEDGNAHSTYELGDEKDFEGEAPAEEQRQRFLEDEGERVKQADVDDKALAKEKKRDKKAKRKEREAAEMAGIVSDDDAAAGPKLQGEDDGHDPLEFLRSLPIAGEDKDSGDDDDDEPPRKKTKKWFQRDDSDDEEQSRKKKSKKGGKVFEVQEGPEALEDLEALAAGLLDG